MIFGFNTDVKYGEAVYHVQSEAQPSTRNLHTTIFLQGRVLGKKSSSYAAEPELSEPELHEMLKSQHRQVLEAIREGRIEQVIGGSA